MGIILRGPGVYSPNHVLTNKDLVNLVDEKGDFVIDTSDEWILSRSGIRERRISLDKSVIEMGVLAAKDLQDRLGGDDLRPEEARIATNKHPGGEFPCYAALVSGALGNNSVASQDVLAGCTGLVYAIADAHNTIKAGEANSSLVGGVERLSDFTNYGDRKTCVLFGDGAGFYLLEERDGEEGIIANSRGGIPDMEGKLAVQYSKGKKIEKRNGEFVAIDVEDNYLVMDGQEVFKFATTVMKRAVHEVLDKSPYEVSDIDVIIPHGANMRIIEAAEKGLGKKGFQGNVFTNMERYGNTSTASIPLAAAEAREKGLIKEGSLVVNVAFGAGFTYGANLYRASRD